jgi:lysophospholipase L1-like esterase
MNIVCFGDSITQVAGAAEADRWTTQLQWLLENWKSGRCTVFNRGIGGNTSSLALDRMAADVFPHLPGVVIVQFGIADCFVSEWRERPRVSLEEFRSNLAEICSLVRKRGGRCALVANHRLAENTWYPQGNGRSMRDNLRSYNAVIREVAAASDLLIDLPALIGSRGIQFEQHLCDDGIHLLPSGNKLYAQLVAEGLIPFLRDLDL